ncbi:MAG TPA: winged helix-turn-helix domain-containing protein, partial [Pyrinomonadaceae bacterium]
MNSKSNRLAFGPFVLDLNLRLLIRDGANAQLEPKVFDTLKYFVQNPGRVLTKSELMKAVWGDDTSVYEGGLQRNISLVRDALEEFGDEYIVTRRREGYIFTPEVTDATEIPDQQCPWVGLSVLYEHDAEYLFGRDPEIADLVTKLKQTDFLAVVGSSGTGKSSLVRAGLIPALRGVQKEESSWWIHVFTPTGLPLRQLANEVFTMVDAAAPTATILDKLV